MILRRFAITTGDVNGIGLEVTLKALRSIGASKGVQFFLFRDSSIQDFEKEILSEVEGKFRSVVVRDMSSALSVDSDFNFIQIVASEPPAKWVYDAAQACNKGLLNGLITAPLSKTEIISSGFKAIGHTDILKEVTGTGELFMTFVGRYFNVILATGHIPLSLVPKELTFDRLCRVIELADKFKHNLNNQKSGLPIALVGLNPHAGEEGLIGLEEISVFDKAYQWAHSRKIAITKPLVPDVAFQKDYWDSYSIYVCPYHDLGLIPFKMVHEGHSGVHITSGLPFIRTSVDHGTAKDIYGKGQAKFESMENAILWALRLTEKS